MRARMWAARAMGVVTVLMSAQPAWAFFTFAQSTMITSAGDGFGSDSSQSDNALLPLPFQLERTRTDGPSSATTFYNFVDNGGVVPLNMQFTHVRGGLAGNTARAQGLLTVLPLEDIIYELDGAYDATGGGRVRLDVSFTEGGTTYFSNFQESLNTSDVSFVLGQQQGDDQNELSGSRTGVLAAGQSYLLQWDYRIEEYGGQLSASADGFLTLTIQRVPEPASLLLLAPGLYCLLRRRSS